MIEKETKVGGGEATLWSLSRKAKHRTTTRLSMQTLRAAVALGGMFPRRRKPNVLCGRPCGEWLPVPSSPVISSGAPFPVCAGPPVLRPKAARKG